MKNLKFSMFINAPRKKVWATMLEDATYREWTKPFNETSYYEGDWSEGSKILFLGTDKDGKVNGGMYSRIAKNIPFEYVSIEHLGEIHDGVEKPWGGPENGFENYKFEDVAGGTELTVDLTGIPDEYADMMNEMWPKALEVLKAISEK
jgi:uncharacterized protein YndB with AHSA1/START domain